MLTPYESCIKNPYQRLLAEELYQKGYVRSKTRGRYLDFLDFYVRVLALGVPLKLFSGPLEGKGSMRYALTSIASLVEQDIQIERLSLLAQAY